LCRNRIADNLQNAWRFGAPSCIGAGDAIEKMYAVAVGLVLTSILTSAPTRAEPFNAPVSVGGNGGEFFRFICPNRAFLVGLSGRTGAFVDHIKMICATWNPATNRLSEPFVDNRQIGTSNGGGQREIRCNQGPLAARDSVIGQMFLSSTLRGDVPVPFVIDDTLTMFCFSKASPTTPVFDRKFGTGTDDGRPERARGFTECPGTNQAVGLYGQRGQFIDRLGLVCDRGFPPS
jgi:hypothetical protein